MTPVTASTIGGIPIVQLQADQLCPAVVVQDGTSTLRLHAGDEESPSTVRYQAQISQTVVECIPGAGQLALSIGVAGQVLLGPQGTPAAINLPIRFVVRNTVTGEVVNSELSRTNAVIEPPEVSALFTLVNRSFVIPQPERQTDYQVLVGFDEGQG
ncbi:MAG: hypothetical protein AAF590_00505 [Pseudomonadota bacterium]